MADHTTDRARAALWGLAIGDALGMPTQMMSHDQVLARFGALDGFRPAAADHPIAAGMPAGSVTDDTEQALVLARQLIAGSGHAEPGHDLDRHLDARAFALALLAWEDDMRARGSLDLLGPSTKAALSAVLEGAPLGETGRYGVTNGAAMRITPVGIAVDTTNPQTMVDRVVEASFVTHNTGVAIAGASAVAAAVSAGIDGADVRAATHSAVSAAERGETRGYWVAAASVPRRIEFAVSLADPKEPERSLRSIRDLIGTSLATQESVPAAFGILAVFRDDPWGACKAAAAQGGDTDTMAAIAGAIAGACTGMGGFPREAIEQIRTVNPSLDLDTIAERLVALREHTP